MDPATNSLRCLKAELDASDLWQLARRMASLAGPIPIPEDDFESFVNGSVDALFSAMSFAGEHDEVIAVGELIEALPRTHEFSIRPNVSTAIVAAINFLQSQAIQPKSLLFLLQITADTHSEWPPITETAGTRIRQFLQSHCLNQALLDHYSTLAIQWIELMSWCLRDDRRCPSSFEI